MILQNFVHISKWLSRNDNCRCFRAGVCFEAAFQRNLRSFLGNWGATLGITKYRLVSLANSFLGDFVESSSFQRCSHHGVRLTAWFFTKCEGGRSARSNDAERHPYSLPSQRGVFTFFSHAGKKTSLNMFCRPHFDQDYKSHPGGGVISFFIYPDPWGDDPILTCAYFSNGLVQPPTIDGDGFVECPKSEP